MHPLSFPNLTIGFNPKLPNIFVGVVGRVHHWYTRTAPFAFNQIAFCSAAKSKQSQTLHRACKPCRTAQSCYAFNWRIISQWQGTLFIRHYPVMLPRHRVPLQRECTAGTAVGSLLGTRYLKRSFLTEAGPRYKWEDYECSHCHVGFPTYPFRTAQNITDSVSMRPLALRSTTRISGSKNKPSNSTSIVWRGTQVRYKFDPMPRARAEGTHRQGL